MTAFIRFVSVLLTASALTASVSAAAKPVAGKRVAVQSSKGKVMLPAGYAKMINDFPEPDPKLLEPIPISNVKSPYGRVDLASSTGSSFPADSAKPVPLAVVSLDSR